MRSRVPHILSIFAISSVLVFLWVRTASGMGDRSQSSSFTEYLPVIAAAQPVYISKLETRTTPGGALWFRGEVMNVAETPICEAEVQALITDENNQTFEFTAPPIFTATLSGQPNPFEIYAAVDPYNIDAISVKISDWTASCEHAIAGATVVSIQEHYEWSHAFITTTIRNDQPVALYNVVGFAWAMETWTFYETQPVIDVLLPGQTAEFFTFLDGLGPMPTLIKAAAQGELEP